MSPRSASPFVTSTPTRFRTHGRSEPVPRAARPYRRLQALALMVTVALVASFAVAHQTRTVGPDDGPRYVLVFGMLNEPAFTNVRSGIDLIVRDEDGDAVPGLAGALRLTVTAPTGAVREVQLRAAHGRAGAYVDDLIWTVPGVYEVRIRGFVGDLEIDERFETHEVRDLHEIRFP
ncbi:MAG: hypothetical protein WD336_04830 [Trueperaceae bacterium]